MKEASSDGACANLLQMVFHRRSMFVYFPLHSAILKPESRSTVCEDIEKLWRIKVQQTWPNQVFICRSDKYSWTASSVRRIRGTYRVSRNSFSTKKISKSNSNVSSTKQRISYHTLMFDSGWRFAVFAWYYCLQANFWELWRTFATVANIFQWRYYYGS